MWENNNYECYNTIYTSEKKIYTAESTPELQVPHDVWQRLLTKTTGPKEGRVDLFDLLKAALRSRPDYIIPGEVRGAEGNIVFQAMQTVIHV